MEWTSNEISPRSFLSMEIVWNPVVVWSTRETLQFTDNRNFKKDVTIILKSIDKTQNKKILNKKALNIKSHAADSKKTSGTTKLTLKSPSPRSKLQKRHINVIVAGSHARKSNVGSPRVVHTNGHHAKNGFDQINQPKRVLGTNNQTNIYPFFDQVEMLTSHRTEKENLVPATPRNVSVIFDSLTFTPTTQTKTNPSNVEYLAAMPTPKSNQKVNQPQFSDFATPMYNIQNETTTILSTTTTMVTPKLVLDQTNTFENFQTPRDVTYSERNELFNDLNEMNRFAMQQTPNSACQSSEVTYHPKQRKLVLDHSEISPPMEIITEHREFNLSYGINRTHTLSSPAVHPYMSIIEEEDSLKPELSETYVKQNETHHRTYNINETNENLARDVSLIGTPLCKKFQSMRELNESRSNLSLEQKVLKCNQGSMPNLHKLESIENNRYYYQSVELDLQKKATNEQQNDEHENLGDTSICSIKSTVSTQSVAFREHEIGAQSSQFNLNEIGRCKPPTFTQSNKFNPCGYNTKATKNSDYYHSGNNHTSNKYLSASSPTINKVSKLSQSTRDIKVESSSSSSLNNKHLIAKNSGKYSSSPSLSAKKRVREEKSDNFRTSFTKYSPPKRLCMASDSPKLGKGQEFRIKTWGGTMPKKFRVPSIPPQRLLLKRPEAERVILFDPELHIRGKYLILYCLFFFFYIC